MNLSSNRLGQYEIIEQIYDGRLVAIYRGYQPSLKRSVAIYILQSDYRREPKFKQAFIRAAEFAATYEHSNIAPIIDYGETDEFPYLVTRFMQGGSLRQKLDNGAMSFQETIKVVQQLSNALDYIHSLGKVHGDPASVNITFDSWGSAYISDFISAGMLSEAIEGFTGVARYAAPERWLGKPITSQTDQYALAAIAYEMLTGQPPFNKPDLIRKHLEDQPPAPQTHRPEIPTAVNDVLFRALAKDPDERYPTIMDFARDFERALQSTPQHLFISYSRRDKDYAKQLQGHMKEGGFQVWIDDAIEHGDQWFNEIHEAIKNCAAFLVIMSPEAEQSEWVQKEILLAKRYKKAIFPLLISGDEFAILIDIQYADLRAGDMPDTDFHRRVSRAVYGVG